MALATARTQPVRIRAVQPAETDDFKLRMSLSEAIQDGALCALGASAPNPCLTTIKFFKDEYIAHVKDQTCPAGVCKDLISYSIDQQTCNGCGACKRQCPQNCISGEKKKPHEIDTDNCIRCGICMESCKFNAVIVQ